jgi:hypothetical protein
MIEKVTTRPLIGKAIDPKHFNIRQFKGFEAFTELISNTLIKKVPRITLICVQGSDFAYP